MTRRSCPAAWAAALLGGMILGACAEAPPPPPERPPAPMETERDDGVMIDTMGNLSPEDVRRTFQNNAARLLGCYQQGLDRMPNLAGDVRFKVRVDREGRVLWAFLQQSVLGDSAVEQCMLEVVRGLPFPLPRGGAAEAEFPIELAPPDAVQYPTPWGPNQAGEVVAAHRPEIDACLAGTTGYTLTAYVAAGGAVTAAGVAPPDADHQGQADCLVQAIRGWTFGDPGPAGAKLSLTF